MRGLRWIVPGLLMFMLILVLPDIMPQPLAAQQFGSGWTGTYFNSVDFSGNPVFTRIDEQINFNYGTGSPVPGFVNTDNFSIRWTNLEDFSAGTYRFTAIAETGVRVYIDNVVIIDRLTGSGGIQNATADVQVTAGTRDLKVEYVALTGNATIQIFWEAANLVPTATSGPSPTPAPPTATGLPAIPAGALTATVIRASVLNVRSAPSLGADRVGSIVRGQTYAIVGRDSNARWFLLQLSGFQAWAYGYYLFVNGNEFNAPVTSSTVLSGIPAGFADTGVLVVTQAGMRLRADPNTVSPQIGRIPWGSFLPVIGRVADNSWYQVVWKGTVGWVYTPYLEIRQGNINNVPIR